MLTTVLILLIAVAVSGAFALLACAVIDRVRAREDEYFDQQWQRFLEAHGTPNDRSSWPPAA